MHPVAPRRMSSLCSKRNRVVSNVLTVSTNHEEELLMTDRTNRLIVVAATAVSLAVVFALPSAAHAVVITPTGAEASNFWTEADPPYDQALPINTINSSGLTGANHNLRWQDMWLSDANAHPWIKFDLGANYILSNMHLWNYNQVNNRYNAFPELVLTNRGFARSDVYISMTGVDGDWTRIADDLAYAQAPGEEDYAGEDYALDPQQMPARYVFLKDVWNFGGQDRSNTGLSEVRFNGTPYIIPEPCTLAVLAFGGLGVLVRRRRTA